MDWEANVRRVIPYIPGEQPNKDKMIKLNTNECPYPPAPSVQMAMEQFQTNQLRLYPDPEAKVLVECLADYYKVEKEQVFVGVGSDDVLAMAFLTFFHTEKPILFPDITYSFYDVWANLFRIPYQTVALDENFRIRKKDYIESGKKKENGGIIFPNPNAPTGVLETIEDIEEIVKANQDVVVIMDEAYVDFGGVSCLPLVDKYENLLVVQTFSKSRSMAGMRIGFAIGSKKLIKYLNDVKFSFNSYTMNQTSLLAGVESIKEEAYFRKTVGKIIHTREAVKKELKELGFSFADSYANFIFVTHPKYAARDIYQALREENIYVRYFDKPRIDNYLRITIGTEEEMQQLIDFLKKYLNYGKETLC